MKDNRRFSIIVYGITGLFIFGVWHFVQESDSGFFETVLIMTICSTLAYDVVFKIVFHIVGKITFVKKLVFGRYYLDGYWIGYYKTYDENNKEQYKYLCEHIEQNVAFTRVHGVSYFECGKISTTWHSYDINFNKEMDRLVFCFESERYRYNHISHGFTISNIIERNNGIPNVIVGRNFTHEENNNIKRIEIYEEKVDISNPTAIQMLEISKEILKKKREYFS